MNARKVGLNFLSGGYGVELFKSHRFNSFQTGKQKPCWPEDRKSSSKAVCYLWRAALDDPYLRPLRVRALRPNEVGIFDAVGLAGLKWLA